MPKIDIVNAKNIIESNPEKAFFKLKNTGGPKGDTGAQGPQGPKGDQGEPGAPGASASVTVGSTTTLSPGADATVTNSGDTRNAILNFGIPTGAQGPQGIQGPKGDPGPMGQTGAKGDTGAAATVQVGNTNTGAPGTNAQVTNAGNEHFAVFNFTIPRGDKGEKGATGAQGAKGDTGEQGPQGIQGPKGDTGSVKSEVVSELPETGEEDTFYLVNREATEQTATGKAINFTNSDNSGDITDFQLDGETSQNGTPTPDAPVAVNTTTGENVVNINGKNLIDVVQRTFDANGVTVTVGADNTITLDGTPSAQYNKSDQITISNTPFLPVGSTYTYSLKYISGSANGGSINLRVGATTTEYNIQFSQNMIMGNADAARTVTMAGSGSVGVSGYVTKIQLVFGTNNTFSNYKIQLQLEAGSSASSFEPYQGQSYEVNLGKNLLAPTITGSRTNQGSTVSYAGDEITLNHPSGGYLGYRADTTTLPMAVKQGQSFALTLKYKSGTINTDGTYSYRFGVYGVKADNSTERFIDLYLPYDTATPSGSIVGTATSDYVGIALGCYVSTATNTTTGDVVFDCQLELGSQATSYAAYFEPIELCKIGDYQDYIYKDGSEWKIHKAVGKAVLDGSVAPTATNTDATNTIRPRWESFLSPAPNSPAADRLLAKSNRFQTVSNWSADVEGIYYDEGSSGQVWLRISKTLASNQTQVVSWLQSNPVYLYYPLGSTSQTDTTITNQALITQLDNVASAPLYTGVNNITTITPNEQGTLEIKYVTYDKYNQNKVYIWNDTLQQWQIIVP